MEEDLRIEWIIEAQDRASKALDAIDEKLLALIEAQEKHIDLLEKMNKSQKTNAQVQKQVAKSTEITAKEQTKLSEKIRRVADAFNETTEVVKTFYNILINFDYNKLIKFLTIIGILLKFKGFSKTGGLFLTIAKNIDIFKTKVEFLGNTIDEVQEKYGSFTGAFLEITGINAAGRAIVDIITKIGLLGGAFVALSSSAKVVKFVEDSVVNLGLKFSTLERHVVNMGTKFPKMSELFRKGIVKTQGAVFGFADAMSKTNYVLNSSANVMRKTWTISKSVGKSFVDGAKHTELFKKGLFGLVTRASAAAGIFSLLGLHLIENDNIMIQMAGGGLIALTLALGGLALLIRQILTLLGDLIYAIGTSLVTAMQKSVDEMAQLQETTASFQFIVESLNESSQGMTGTFEEWNAIVDEFSKTQRFNIEVTQRSVSELLRFGDSIGLTKAQMKSLLPVISSLAKANHKDLFQSTLAVLEALNGQTQMLQNMGVNLTQHAIATTKAGKAAHGHFEKLAFGEQIMIRYNALLEKSAVLNGLVAETANTIKQQLARQEVAWTNINTAMGIGAELIEQKVNVAWTYLLETLEKTSKSLLSVGGFLTALSGRALQATGIFFKWAFAIVFVTTSIKALNIVLKNNYIQNFAGQVANCTLITKKLASVSTLAAATLQKAFLTISTTGLTINSVLGLIGAGMSFVLKQALILIAPFAIIAIKIGLVIAACYLLYKAFVLIEKKTKIFSTIWQDLVKWFEETGPIIRAVKIEFLAIGNFLKGALLISVRLVTLAILSMAKGFLKTVIYIKKAIVSVRLAFANAGAFIAKIASKFNIISTAYAAEINEAKKSTEKMTANTEAQEKSLRVVESVMKDITGEIFKIYNAQELATDAAKKNAEANKNNLEIQRDYIKELEKIREKEKQITSEAKARIALKIREFGGATAERVVAGTVAGGAAGGKEVAKALAQLAATAIAGPAGGEAAGMFVDFFGKSTEEFRKQMDEFVGFLVDFPIMLAENIPIFIDKLVRAIPRIISALRNAMPAFLQAIVDIMSDPTFWSAVVDALANSILITMGDPVFWLRVAGAFITAIIQGVPRIIRAFIKGVKLKFAEIFGNFADIMKDIGDVFKDVGDVFKSILDGLKEVAKTVTGGGIVGGLVSKVPVVGGTIKSVGSSIPVVGGLFKYGGIIGRMEKLQKAQYGLIAGRDRFGDRTLIRANKDEMVLNRDQQRKLWETIVTGNFGPRGPETISVPLQVGKHKLAEVLLEMKDDGYLARVVA